MTIEQFFKMKPVIPHASTPVVPNGVRSDDFRELAKYCAFFADYLDAKVIAEKEAVKWTYEMRELIINKSGLNAKIPKRCNSIFINCCNEFLGHSDVFCMSLEALELVCDQLTSLVKII